jgi:hypothetical protein
VLGTPIPSHVLEVLHRGAVADAGRALEVLGLRPVHSTPEVVQTLYEWATVIHLPARASAA